MTRKAIIVGSRGQDGQLLWSQLEHRGYTLIGWTNDGPLGRDLPANLCGTSIEDEAAVASLVGHFRPDEVYFLAAHHHSAEEAAGDSPHLFRRSFDVHVNALVNFLEAIRHRSPASRLFYAASSHIFGSPACELQDESTPIFPESPYGISKAAGLFTCRHYRHTYGIFAAAGILYNHESPLRPDKFLSRRICRGVAQIKHGQQDKLVLGNLDTIADWGYAPDYTEAMFLILAAPVADDFVVATGKPHTVRDFARIAFAVAGLDYEQFICLDPAVVHRSHRPLVGNPTHLMQTTGWKPSIDFVRMVQHFVTRELAAASAS